MKSFARLSKNLRRVCFVKKTIHKRSLYNFVLIKLALQLPEIKRTFNLAFREVKRLVKEAHRDFEMNIAEGSKLNPKILYAYVNRQTLEKNK